MAPQWNLCNAPGADEPKVAKSKVEAVRKFLGSTDKTLVCTHATFRFAVEELGAEAFDNRLLAIDEFHHVSANPDNRLGSQLGAFIARDKVHIVARRAPISAVTAKRYWHRLMKPGSKPLLTPITNS